MMAFNQLEEKWFINWVVMRRKFRVSQANVRELIVDIKDMSAKISELEYEIEELKKIKNPQMSNDYKSVAIRQRALDTFQHKQKKEKKNRKKHKKYKGYRK